MPVQVACPSCQRKLKVPDNLVGKTVRCPGCQGTFAANVEGADPVVDSSPAPPPPMRETPAERAPASSSRRRDEEFSEEPPRRRRDRDEDDDRPRRPSRLVDDDDDYPRRGRRSRGNLAPHRGTMILIMGILGLMFCPLIGIPAWLMGNADMTEIRAGRMDPEGESITQVGRILGILSTILLVVQLGIFCLVFAAAVANG